MDRERQLQACLRDEESFERRSYLRQVQQELKERQLESAHLKVRSLFVLAFQYIFSKLDNCYIASSLGNTTQTLLWPRPPKPDTANL